MAYNICQFDFIEGTAIKTSNTYQIDIWVEPWINIQILGKLFVPVYAGVICVTKSKDELVEKIWVPLLDNFLWQA